MATTTTSVHVNLHHPEGGGSLTLEELSTLREQGLRAAASRALEDGYVVTIGITNEEHNAKLSHVFDNKDQMMSMGEFFDIIERLKDEPSK